MPLNDPFPSQLHIDKFVKELLSEYAKDVQNDADDKPVRHIVFLQGEHTLNRHDTDRELPFREFQEC